MMENRKLILFTFFLILVLLALYFSISIFLISLIGIGMGVLFSPALSFFKRKLSLPRALSAAILFLLTFFLISGVLYSIWYFVSDQIMALADRAPNLTEDLNKKISLFLDRTPWIKEQLQGLNLGSGAKEITTRFIKGLRIGAEALMGLGFAIVLALYTAISLPEYFKSIVRVFPASQRERAKTVLQKCATTLRVWFRAMAIDMALLGVITTLSLWALGVEFWAVFGLMTAVFAIVPYVGILFVVATAGLITLASDPSMVIWVLVVFGVTQQIEANVILPLIMKNQVQLPEVPLLIFILFLGVWFGLLGIFIAPPLFAVMRVLYIEFYLAKMNRC